MYLMGQYLVIENEIAFCEAVTVPLYHSDGRPINCIILKILVLIRNMVTIVVTHIL
jgi:hypothetical protein